MNRVISKYIFYYPLTFLKGEKIYKYLRDYRRSQYWSGELIQKYQVEKLKELLKVAKTSKFYQYLEIEELLEMDGQGFLKEFSLRVPELAKKDIILSGSKMITDSKAQVTLKTTGGSTGEPVTVAKTAAALGRERAATWRAYEWAGIKVGAKQARFWGVPHTKLGRVKAFLADFIANRRRFSAFDMDGEAIKGIFEKLIASNPDYLYGYVSAIRALAVYAESLDKDIRWPFQSIITTSEVLTDKDRELFARVFNKPVFDEYGCGEVGSIAHECSHGHLHIMAENVYVEQDEKGELIVTDLHNHSMPLIRYRIGDYGSVDAVSCSCSLGLPVLSQVKGRAYDIVESPEGRRIHPEAIIYIFEDMQNKMNCFSQFQVIQKSKYEFLINLIPNGEWEESFRFNIESRFKDFISAKIKVQVSLVSELPRERSGKMRVVKVEC